MKNTRSFIDNHKQGLLSLSDATLSHLTKKKNEYLKTSLQTALELSKELSITLIDGEQIANFIIEQ